MASRRYEKLMGALETSTHPETTLLLLSDAARDFPLGIHEIQARLT